MGDELFHADGHTWRS